MSTNKVKLTHVLPRVISSGFLDLDSSARINWVTRSSWKLSDLLLTCLPPPCGIIRFRLWEKLLNAYPDHGSACSEHQDPQARLIRDEDANAMATYLRWTNGSSFYTAQPPIFPVVRRVLSVHDSNFICLLISTFPRALFVPFSVSIQHLDSPRLTPLRQVWAQDKSEKSCEMWCERFLGTSSSARGVWESVCWGAFSKRWREVALRWGTAKAWTSWPARCC